MTERVVVASLSVAKVLHEFIVKEVLPGTGVPEAGFWARLDRIVHDLAPRNRALLKKRDELQAKIDAWHRAQHGKHIGKPFDRAAYKAFLAEIGYLVPEGPDFAIDTANVDAEIAHIAGPQLVVPVTNARYALNAANARWGSLYDALYGTDALPEDDGATRGRRLQPGPRRQGVRLDQALPRRGGAARQGLARRGAGLCRAGRPPGGEPVERRRYLGRQRAADDRAGGAVQLIGLADPSQLVGYRGDPAEPRAVLLAPQRPAHRDPDRQPALHRQGRHRRRRRRAGRGGADHHRGLEDFIAAVDADDKVAVYRNWLGLMKGTSAATFDKGGRQMERRLNPDRVYTTPDGGGELTLPGRSLLLVRNVGHLMTDASVLDRDDQPVPEGILDARGHRRSSPCTTSRATAPSATAAPARSTSSSRRCTGPRRWRSPTSCSIASRTRSACRATPSRWASWTRSGAPASTSRSASAPPGTGSCFINTGFLDRTGDEIHTSMEAGPMIRKGDMKAAPWIKAYEDWNVDIGLACGLPGRAQIGKGMWAMPDRMADMLATKIGHPQAGANTAWVPSPTAATLHALHYHKVDVARRQAELRSRPRASLGRHPDDPAGRPRELVAGGHPEGARQQRARASWATWCAGSIRASAAPRCPTSTTSA